MTKSASGEKPQTFRNSKFKIVKLLVISALLLTGCYTVRYERNNQEVITSIQRKIENKDYGSALTDIELQLTKGNSSEYLLLAKGYLLIRLNRLKEAEEHYRKLETFMDSSPEVGNNLAIIYKLQGKHLRAIQVFEETIKSHPQSRDLYQNLGDYHLELANRNFKQASKLRPQEGVNDQLAAPGENNSDKTKLVDQYSAKVVTESAPHNSPETPDVHKNNNDTESVKHSIRRRIDEWVDAWEGRNIEQYFSFFMPDFVPNLSTDSKSWKTRKTELFKRSGNIAVEILGLEFLSVSAKTIQVRFLQIYQSDIYGDVTSLG